MKPTRIDILGVPVDSITKSQAQDCIHSMLQGNEPQMIIAINPEKVIKAQNDAKLLNQLQKAGLLIPDGIGVVLAGKILKGTRLERVPGSELMPSICDIASQRGCSIFLFGASPEVNERAAQILERRFTGIKIAGRQHGHLSENEMEGVVEQVNASHADILFVALGSPRQENWMEQHLPKLHVKVCQGVGGTFDVIAGRVKRAPKFFRDIHLEWLYRLLVQPQRILRQLALPKFAVQVIKQKVFQQGHDTA